MIAISGDGGGVTSASTPGPLSQKIPSSRWYPTEISSPLSSSILASHCFHDSSCAATPPRAGGVGCNAHGSRNCRFCGFSTYGACPYEHIATFSSAFDGSTPALAFDACLGSSPYGCQVSPFATFEGVVSPGKAEATFPLARLACDATYYLTSRATACSGLQKNVVSRYRHTPPQPPTAI